MSNKEEIYREITDPKGNVYADELATYLSELEKRIEGLEKSKLPPILFQKDKDEYIKKWKKLKCHPFYFKRTNWPRIKEQLINKLKQ